MYFTSPAKRVRVPRRVELTIADVQPHSQGGVGLLTEHPVGLLVVAAVILLTMEYIPTAGWFFGGSLVLGGVIGFGLWLCHR